MRQDAGTLERLIGDDFQLVTPGESNQHMREADFQAADLATGYFPGFQLAPRSRAPLSAAAD